MADAAPPLCPLRIGPIEIDLPVVQAALSGYSDWPMRIIARRLGAPYVLGEVLLDQFILSVTRAEGPAVHPGERRGASLRGATDGGPARRSSHPAALEARRRPVSTSIDLNFGCPVKKVLGRCRGGFLLSQPQTALEIVSRVRDALPPRGPADRKDAPRHGRQPAEPGELLRDLRRRLPPGRGGDHRPRPDRPPALRGTELLAVPPRGETARRDRTVLGSGDLFTPQDCLDMLAQTGVDGVTVARGAIGNPWIFRQVRELGRRPAGPAPGLGRAARDPGRALSAGRSGLRPPPHLRRHAEGGHPGLPTAPWAGEVRAAFVAVKSKDQWHAVLDRWYCESQC